MPIRGEELAQCEETVNMYICESKMWIQPDESMNCGTSIWKHDDQKVKQTCTIREFKPDGGTVFTHVTGATYAYSLSKNLRFIKTCGIGDHERGELMRGNGKLFTIVIN